jgi:hypothetical protein
MWLSLLSLALAQVPFPVALSSPNRVTSLQPLGPPTTGGAVGGIAQYTLYDLRVRDRAARRGR